MSNSFSLYLDLIRFCAASLVVLYHSNVLSPAHNVLLNLGPEAVIIFFVLSGYVIAYVSEAKERTLQRYAVSRIARIYSVAVPAICVTALCDVIGYHLFPPAYPAGYHAWDFEFVRAASATFFLNQIWFLDIQLFSNVPYWSLNFEVWYYIGFACVTFVEGRKRWWLLLGVSLFVGPKIVLLMPTWWLGVWLYRSPRLRAVRPYQGLALLAISSFGFYVYLRYGGANWGSSQLEATIGPWIYRQLSFSKRFIADYYLALVIAANFVGIRSVSPIVGRILHPAERSIRYFSSFTFALYLTHQPLMFFFTAVFRVTEISIKNYVLVLSCTVISSLAIGALTERKKDLWRRWVTTIWDSIEGKIARDFGTYRGFLRTALGNCLWYLGRYKEFASIDWRNVQRIVFVCQGNICRSPFAEAVGHNLLPELTITSVGLSASSGSPAFALAQHTTSRYGADLSAHRSVDITEFVVLDGDLILAMEDRHIARLRPYVDGRSVQIGLLGLWCRPRFALLYDPYLLSGDYFSACFNRIFRAVSRLAEEARGPDGKPRQREA